MGKLLHFLPKEVHALSVPSSCSRGLPCSSWCLCLLLLLPHHVIHTTGLSSPLQAGCTATFPLQCWGKAMQWRGIEAGTGDGGHLHLASAGCREPLPWLPCPAPVPPPTSHPAELPHTPRWALPHPAPCTPLLAPQGTSHTPLPSGLCCGCSHDPAWLHAGDAQAAPCRLECC